MVRVLFVGFSNPPIGAEIEAIEGLFPSVKPDKVQVEHLVAIGKRGFENRRVNGETIRVPVMKPTIYVDDIAQKHLQERYHELIVNAPDAFVANLVRLKLHPLRSQFRNCRLGEVAHISGQGVSLRFERLRRVTGLDWRGQLIYEP